MRAFLIVPQQFQPEYLPIEMGGRHDIFGPQANDGKSWQQEIILGNKTTSTMTGWS
jgi:hypothetical protein